MKRIKNIFPGSIIVALALNCTNIKRNRAEIPTNSFESHFKRTKINYKYSDKFRIHDYSKNWDFDGDGVLDKVKFIGNEGVHLKYNLSVTLSSEKHDRFFKWLYVDYPLLEVSDSLELESLAEHKYPQFVVADFNADGLNDIYINMNEHDIDLNKKNEIGILTSRIVISYNREKSDFRYYDFKSVVVK